MSNIFVVNWTPDEVELRQVPSVGIYQPHIPTIRKTKLNRPTRSERFSHADSGGGFNEALRVLFSDIEVTQPVWFLIPRDWVQDFEVDNPNLDSDEMMRAHLIWEVQQRLSGDISDYKVYIPTDLKNAKLTLSITRGEVIEIYISAFQEIGIEIAGIRCEPDFGADYDFDKPEDFRDAVPADIIDSIDSIGLKNQRKVSPIVIISLGAIILFAVIYIWVLPSDQSPLLESNSIEEIAIEETASSGSLIETTTLDENLSPVGQLTKFLPSTAALQFAVLSAVDCKFEINGLDDPNEWLNKFTEATTYKTVKLDENYQYGSQNVTTISLEQTEWKKIDGKTKSVEYWSKLSSAKGMEPHGRISRGNLSSALELIEAVWSEPGGFEKVYLTQDKEQWAVTIQ
ncbi:MAG: hypothetical protein P9X24_03515 [Candidatus Hatepunaea meridiana]|nr:hypothetical protein [Candidatus Hatepunaea meridiana]